MIQIKNNHYHVYISTDITRENMVTGVAGDLRIHIANLEAASALKNSDCVYLVYWESYKDVQQAIVRERKLRSLSKKKKIKLISEVNPQLAFLNEFL